MKIKSVEIKGRQVLTNDYGEEIKVNTCSMNVVIPSDRTAFDLLTEMTVVAAEALALIKQDVEKTIGVVNSIYGIGLEPSQDVFDLLETQVDAGLEVQYHIECIQEAADFAAKFQQVEMEHILEEEIHEAIHQLAGLIVSAFALGSDDLDWDDDDEEEDEFNQISSQSL